MQISNYLSNLLNIQKYWKASWLIFSKGSAAGFRLFCVRTGCPRLPSPQTRSSAGSSAQWSPGRSRVLTLETKTALFDFQRLVRSRNPAEVKHEHNTWHFEPSKWHLHRSDVVVVDETGTSFQLLHHAMGSCHIPMQKVETALRLFCFFPFQKSP